MALLPCLGIGDDGQGNRNAWFPEPELITTGFGQPLMRASLPAAARATARNLTSLP